MRRVTRARYHRAIIHIDRHVKTISMNKMADAIVSNRSRDLWCESNKLRCSNNLILCTIDGNNDSTSITDMFSDKYDTLHNSVPYDTNHMKLIEREIMSRVQKCNNESYIITVHDVMNAEPHLKDSKSDGYE